MRLPTYLALVHTAEETLASAFRQVADGHGDEPDVHFTSLALAQQCRHHADALTPVIGRYGEADGGDEPERLHADGLDTTRTGPLGLLRDLQDVYLLATLVDVTWRMIGQAARALRDTELLEVVDTSVGETGVQLDWLRGRMSQAAPQALIAAG